MLRPAIILLFLARIGFAQIAPADTNRTSTTTKQGLAAPKSSSTGKANLLAPPDSSAKDSITPKVPKISKNAVQTTVNYEALDSMRFEIDSKMVYLYGNAAVDYGEISLKAGQMEVNWADNLIYAHGITDSAGKLGQKPVFKQGIDQYVAKTIKYNLKTRKGIISEVVTEQSGGYVHGHRVKKNEYNEMFISDAQYTTCNLEHPHFYIHAEKIKVIPNDKLMTGPFNLVILDIPTPLGFLFGLFPAPKKRSSGIIVPTYGEAADRGFFLRNGGYYLALNEYIDLKLLGEIYSKGSYGLRTASNYRKRYAYSGAFDLNYIRRKTGDEGFEVISPDYSLTWSHTPESRGSSRFSSSVNIVSNSFNRRNTFDPNNYLATSFSSNVSYSKTFVGTPFSMTANSRLQQNVQTKAINLELPSLTLNMNRIFPFKRASSSGKSWYEKLSFAYDLTASNNIDNSPVGQRAISGPPVKREFNRMNDSLIRVNTENIGLLLSRAKTGIRHNVPLSTTVNLFKHFNITPGLNYSESWHTSRLAFVNLGDSVDVDTVRRFSRSYEYGFSVGLATRIYGTKYFKKGRVEAIRHMMIPSLSYSYRPDFSDPRFGMYQQVRLNNGREYRLSYFQNSLNPAPGPGLTSSLNFSATNTFEMKVKNPNDTTGKEKFKKIMLIDNLSANTSYNMAADSFKLSTINLSARTRILNRIDISIGGTVDPYQYLLVEQNPITGAVVQRRIDQLALQNTKPGLGQISSANLSFATNLNPKARTPKKLPASANPNQVKNLATMPESDLDFINANPDLYVDFNLPWSLNLAYNLNYTKQGFAKSRMSQVLNFNGDVSVTEKWKIGLSSAYDFQLKKLGYTNINIYRDLHCWEMRINWIPFGQRQSYSFDLNVRASILQDLKLSRRRSWYDR